MECKNKSFTTKQIQREGILNATKEGKQFKDLKYLKNHKYPGPFTFKGDISHFMNEIKYEKGRTDWLYMEVRYAKTNSGFQDNKSMFRLRKDGINWQPKIMWIDWKDILKGQNE